VWGDAVLSGRLGGRGGVRVIVSHPSPLACAEERASEVAEEIASAHPRWSPHRPVHLVGHSLGGLTCRTLHALLEASALRVGGARHVASITSLFAPHAGLALPYALGLDAARPPAVRYGSAGHALGTAALAARCLGGRGGLPNARAADGAAPWHELALSVACAGSARFGLGAHAAYDVSFHAARAAAPGLALAEASSGVRCVAYAGTRAGPGEGAPAWRRCVARAAYGAVRARLWCWGGGAAGGGAACGGAACGGGGVPPPAGWFGAWLAPPAARTSLGEFSIEVSSTTNYFKYE
jgi:hypothetical protein